MNKEEAARRLAKQLLRDEKKTKTNQTVDLISAKQKEWSDPKENPSPYGIDRESYQDLVYADQQDVVEIKIPEKKYSLKKSPTPFLWINFIFWLASVPICIFIAFLIYLTV